MTFRLEYEPSEPGQDGHCAYRGCPELSVNTRVSASGARCHYCPGHARAARVIFGRPATPCRDDSVWSKGLDEWWTCREAHGDLR